MAVETEPEFLSRLFDALSGIERSVTGPGMRQSLGVFGPALPLGIETVPSGTAVFDWSVPEDWRLRSGRLTGPDGVVYADSALSPGCVVGHSASTNTFVDLTVLRKNLHSLPDQPDAVPRVASLYERTWGFCLPQAVVETLPRGRYHVAIDSKFTAGILEYGHGTLPGETDQEVVLASYLCHPDLPKNELSGPLVMLALAQRLAQWPRRRYTYRFLFTPDAIGSLCFLQKHGDELKRKIVAGLILSNLGGPRTRLTYCCSKGNESLMDTTMRFLQQSQNRPIDIKPYVPPTGWDVQRFNAPEYGLPFASLQRTPPGQVSGDHNAVMTKDFMGIDSLIDAVNHLEAALQRFEVADSFVSLQEYTSRELEDGKRVVRYAKPQSLGKLIKDAKKEIGMQAAYFHGNGWILSRGGGGLAKISDDGMEIIYYPPEVAELIEDLMGPTT